MPQDTRNRKKTARKEPSINPAAGTGRVPPHSLDMERGLICSALIDPNGMAMVADVVSAESFYDQRHSLIFGAMRRLSERSRPIDILTVTEELKAGGELESAGGDAYVISLSNEVATSAHAEHYARVVQEKKALRRLITTSAITTSDAYEAPDAEDLINRAMQELFDIYGSRTTGGFQKLEPILKKVHERLDELHKIGGKEVTGVPTGFEQLDQMTDGFHGGEFIVIAGRPSMGKTAFSLDLARHACSRGTSVAFFSLEMNYTDIAMRLLAAQASLNLHKLRSGKLSDRAWARLAEATGELSELPFWIDDTGTLGLTELRARARMLKQQHNIQIIFIDYLQLMKPPKADSREQEVAQISRALKGLARELKVPVVAMSQLSRAIEQRADRRPQLSDLRDSGAIEQDADVVMFIVRKSNSEGDKDGDSEGALTDETEISIKKQRNGPTGEVHLIFHREYAHFVAKEEHDALGVPERVDADEDTRSPF